MHMHDDHDEGLTTAGRKYLISDRDLDALAEAEMAFVKHQRARRWWLVGCIDGQREDDEADIA